jgi:hypothetical protein
MLSRDNDKAHDDERQTNGENLTATRRVDVAHAECRRQKNVVPTWIFAQIIRSLNNAWREPTMKPFITLGISHIDNTEGEADPMNNAKLQIA